jgi:uncharacterized membrane protein YedE/YeeE
MLTCPHDPERGGINASDKFELKYPMRNISIGRVCGVGFIWIAVVWIICVGLPVLRAWREARRNHQAFMLLLPPPPALLAYGVPALLLLVWLLLELKQRH